VRLRDSATCQQPLTHPGCDLGQLRLGKALSTADTVSNPFRYTSREWDAETGLYYYRARYYDPQIGRFISEDPMAFGAGTNFYIYVENSPVTKYDPTGLATCDYYIKGEPGGNGWLYCRPDDPRNSGVSFMAASGNNGDPRHHCKNNPQCAPKGSTGPIPPGPYHFVGTPGSRKHGGTRVVPDDPAKAYYRNGLLTHFCAQPFGPSRNKPFCSEGCITATPDDIKKLNKLLTLEPNSTLTVYSGLPQM